MIEVSKSATDVLYEDEPSKIGRATAVLMHRFGVDELRAHRILHRLAMRTGMSVEAVAAQVLATSGAASALWR
jgi:AmiR/NasT family two-component response regulator